MLFVLPLIQELHFQSAYKFSDMHLRKDNHQEKIEPLLLHEELNFSLGMGVYEISNPFLDGQLLSYKVYLHTI